MPEVYCDRVKCLNNKKNYCTASTVEYTGRLCQTYLTVSESRKSPVGICRRVHGKLRTAQGNILK